jgi:hypothetical protein
MKNNISGILLVALMLGMGFLACVKKVDNTFYPNGSSTSTLTATATSITLTAADSMTNVIGFSWTNPHFATDSASEQYILQIDSAGHGFAQPDTVITLGALADSLTAKRLNTIVLSLGANYNVPYTVEVRLVSSYSNNNEQVMSNTLSLTVTPYTIPPKVVPPTALYLVGSVTQGTAWSNPVQLPTAVYQFEQVDSVDYAGVFNLTAGGQFLVVPVNGSWANKFATADNSETGTGGTFAYNASNNFTGPATAGWYTIWFNFQAGTYTITPYTEPIIPDSLFIVGSATADGWNNPVPEPGQVLTQINSTQFTVTLPLSAGGQYLFLPTNGSWTNKFAAPNSNTPPASGGSFGYNPNSTQNGTFNTNISGPANAGTYTITADFLNYTYKATQ